MTPDQLRDGLYEPLKQTLQDTLYLGMTRYGPNASEATRDLPKWERIKTELGGLIDAFEMLKVPRMPVDRALADIRLRAPALGRIADEFEAERASGHPIIERLEAGQKHLQTALASYVQR